MRVTLVFVLLVGSCSQANEVRPPDAAPPAPPDAAVHADAAPKIDARPPADAGPPDAPEAPPRYTTSVDDPFSPITPSVAASILDIVARGEGPRDEIFAKIGDSITVAPQFLACFVAAGVDLGTHTELQPTLDFFKGGDAAGKTPFNRVSLAATVGWSADAVLANDPSTPLAAEIAAIHPRYAVLMFGSNDVVARSIFQFGQSMLEITSRLVDQGIVPIMSTIPPDTQTATGGANVPKYNLVVRGIAQGRQVPLMDYFAIMDTLPSKGLGSDGLHPNSLGNGCKLTDEGLMYGYNVRNWLTLETLDRARSILEGNPPPDAAGTPATSGSGTYTDPFLVKSFPYTDLRDTHSGTNVISTYSGCNATQNESGPEIVYKLILTSPVTVHAMVFDHASDDIDVHLLSGTTADSCLMRNDKEITADLVAGTYYFVLDSFVPMGGAAQAGEYLFVLESQ